MGWIFGSFCGLVKSYYYEFRVYPIEIFFYKNYLMEKRKDAET